MKKIIHEFLKLKYFIFLLFLTFFAVKPLLHPGLPPTHDGENHVIRVYEFDKALRDGDIYPRWVKDLNKGYGVPLFNYVYPMPNYMGELFHIFGASFIDAFKLNLLIATIIGVLFFYLWMRLFLSSVASLTAAIFYAFAPYRFVDIYVRGSVGEVWALAFFPAFLWSVTKLVEKQSENKMIYLIVSSLFLAGAIFSHNILALMCMLFGVSYAAFLLSRQKWSKKKVLQVSIIFVLSLLLSAIFWLPALVETKYVQGLQIYDIDANFPELFQLLIPSWGTGFSGGGLENQMSFQIGVTNLIAVFVGLLFLIRFFRKKSPLKGLLIFTLVWFAVVFYLLLGVSKPVWHTVPLLDYFQFPWRFLSLIIIICSVIAGVVIEMIKGKKKRIVFAIAFVAMAVSTTIAYTQPAYYHDRTDDHYITRENFIHGTNSPGDVFNTKWMNNKLPFKKNRIEVLQGKAKITAMESKTSVHRFIVDSENVVKMVANIAYFPGWTLHVDGKGKELKPNKDGIMEFTLPQGKHMVELRLNDTMIRKFASGLSILALLACLLLFIFRKKILV